MYHVNLANHPIAPHPIFLQMQLTTTKKTWLQGPEHGRLLMLQQTISIRSHSSHRLADLKNRVIIILSILKMLIFSTQMFNSHHFLHQTINSIHLRWSHLHTEHHPSALDMFQMDIYRMMLEMELFLENQILHFIIEKVHLRFTSRRYLLVILLLQVIICLTI